MNVLERLSRAFAAATPEGGDASAFAAAVRPSTDPKFGDYQANGCMALAKRARQNPRDMALAVASRVDLAPLADSPEVAGPGFLNVRLRDEWLSETLGDLVIDESLGLSPPETPRTVVIDYSSPNVAKPMHVGHVRSTVIGDSLARTFSALGHRVIRDNHLGDWGSQFGMILWGWKNHRDESAYEADPVSELARLYRLAQSRIKAGESLAERFAKVFALESQGKPDEAAAAFDKLAEGTGLTRPEVDRVIADGRSIADASRAETARLHAGRDRKISKEIVFKGNEAAWVKAVKEHYPDAEEIVVRIDAESGNIDAVKDGAKMDPSEFGRIGSEATKQDIIQKIRQVMFQEGREAGRDELSENRALWERFIPHCLTALQGVYDRLGVRFDVQLGESFYDPMLAGVVESLRVQGLAEESEGATVVFIEGANAPFLIRKSDGAYNYATTDLATIQYRVQTWNPDLILYVVDHRQGDHFKGLFHVARRWGYDEVGLEHVAFGTILGGDRRPFKTREGDVVGLESLLDEAVAEALEVVKENCPDLDPESQGRVAEVIGIGAIKYADLSQNRLSDYVFNLKKMVAMTGNTGAYLQYAYARVQSIFRKGGFTPEAIRRQHPPIALSNPAERALGVQILRLPETLELVASELKPNILTDYLFELANKFSTFFEECPVLKAESPERRDSRLALADLTARTLRFGLDLLGIEVVDRM